jgi:hypothetical protein
MNWLVFAIFAYIVLALDLGLRILLAIPDAAGTGPSLTIILAVFIALWAPNLAGYWALLILGLLTDLIGPWKVVGPGALGFAAAGFLVVQLRPMVVRESLLTLAILVFAAGLFAHLVITALILLRGLPFVAGLDPGWSAADQLLRGFFEVVYSALMAVPVGWLLGRLRPLWAFQIAPGGTRRF